MLKKLYIFIADPKLISFEDDIVLNVKQFIRRNKKVS